ncbi:MAG: hypothetical protein A3K10_03215 [Bacteroidetes bacterium RIFCSPLOWO2_12_FULL_31_6]|nr:MAG: hypothetical protein A3K10_03215 [Bacteroidetes bacterium RIFCSPLOWO2_12_FULL_31_6]
MSKDHPQNAVYDTVLTSVQNKYTIQQGDILFIEISAFNLTESRDQQGNQPLQGYATASSSDQSIELKGFTVNSEGNVDLPVLGKLSVQGLTVDDVRSKVILLANEYYSNAQVKVFLLNNYVTIVGEVNLPGRYHVYKENLSLIEALALANDCKEWAEREKIKVMRTQNGKTHIYFVDVTDLSIASSTAFYVQPNDVIMVKAQSMKRVDSKDFSFILSGVAALISSVNMIFLINSRYISGTTTQ